MNRILKIKVTGNIFFILIWAITIPIIILLLIFLFLSIEQKLPLKISEEVIEILDLKGNTMDAMDGSISSSIYLVKMKNGREKDIEFDSSVIFYKNDFVKIRYKETPITKLILIQEYSKVK